MEDLGGANGPPLGAFLGRGVDRLSNGGSG